MSLDDIFYIYFFFVLHCLLDMGLVVTRPISAGVSGSSLGLPTTIGFSMIKVFINHAPFFSNMRVSIRDLLNMVFL